MRAIVIPTFGDPSVLAWREVEGPVPGPEEVLVTVRASALNRADLLQRRGRYPAPAGAPADIPGLEFAGEVAAVGPRVFAVRPGDRVMGILGGGGHAEQVVVHERMCLPVPDGLSWTEAGAIPEAFLTAFDALVLQAGAGAGSRVLVPAAASGVGTAAGQIVRAIGGCAIGLSRTADKRDRLAGFGFRAAFDPADPGVADAIRAAAGGGIDVVLDLVGAAQWALHVDVLAPRGRIVLVGTMAGAKVEANLSVLMAKRATVIGTVLRSRPLEEKIAVTQAFARQMLPLLRDGALRPVVDRTFPLAEAAAAHAYIEGNANVGKVVLLA